VDERELFHGGSAARTSALLKLWRRLLLRHYDLCAVMQYDRRYALLSRVVRAGRRLQLDHADRRSKLIDGRWHANEYARILGLTPDEYHEENVRLLRPDEDQIPVSKLETKDMRRIALAPAGAKNVLREGALRRWPIENYVALSRELLARGYEIVLTGSSDDAWARAPFAELLSAPGMRDGIGKTQLPELLALFDACDAVITHDTGAMHIAGISRADVIAIFGPTAMSNFLPRRERVVGLWGGERLPCRPCYDGRDFAPCKNNVCVQEVSVTQVLAALDALMRN
jgi:heptosyltransferase-2